MLRSSSEMAKLYGRFLLQTRGIVNYEGVGRGSGNGIRRPSSPSPSPSPSSSPTLPPAVEKDEWWAVDGELFRAEKFDPKQVLSPLENEHIPNKKRRKDRMKHLAQTRLKFRNQGQEAYWAAYMRRYQILRNEWEKLVWDPKPEPKPKSRNPLFVAEETEKYVWRDPRRDAYKMNNQPLGRMDKSLPTSKFETKNAVKVQNMDRYPFAWERDTGRNRSQGQGHGMEHQSQKHRDDVSSFKTDDELEGLDFNWDDEESESGSENEENETENEREHKSSLGKPLSCGSSGPGRPTSHRTKSHRTKDYFKKLDEDFVGDYNNKKGSKSKVNGMDNLPRHQHDVSSSENDDEIGGLESWDEDESESRSEDESESASESEVASEHESEQKSGPKRRGWYGHEDDLFKDTDSD